MVCREAGARAIRGFEGHYQVSETGVVWDLHRDIEVVPYSKGGYLWITVECCGVPEELLLPLVQYEAFYGPIKETQEVVYRDLNKYNTMLKNLQVLSGRELKKWKERYGRWCNKGGDLKR